eukprot:6200430-Pleurochrysis_carterae.AAC.2
MPTYLVCVCARDAHIPFSPSGSATLPGHRAPLLRLVAAPLRSPPRRARRPLRGRSSAQPRSIAQTRGSRPHSSSSSRREHARANGREPQRHTAEANQSQTHTIAPNRTHSHPIAPIRTRLHLTAPIRTRSHPTAPDRYYAIGAPHVPAYAFARVASLLHRQVAISDRAHNRSVSQRTSQIDLLLATHRANERRGWRILRDLDRESPVWRRISSERSALEPSLPQEAGDF